MRNNKSAMRQHKIRQSRLELNSKSGERLTKDQKNFSGDVLSRLGDNLLFVLTLGLIAKAIYEGKELNWESLIWLFLIIIVWFICQAGALLLKK